VTKIAIGTTEMPPREGENRSRMVSTMEITMSKEKKIQSKSDKKKNQNFFYFLIFYSVFTVSQVFNGHPSS
jgi:antirestriction protein ArdC